jgi:hypothetical protein
MRTEHEILQEMYNGLAQRNDELRATIAALGKS